MPRGGPGRGQGRNPTLTLAQELWIEARAEALWRDAWTKRRISFLPRTERTPIKWVGNEAKAPEAMSQNERDRMARTAATGKGTPPRQLIEWMRYADDGKPHLRDKMVDGVLKKVRDEASQRFGITISTHMVKRILRAARRDV